MNNRYALITVLTILRSRDPVAHNLTDFSTKTGFVPGSKLRWGKLTITSFKPEGVVREFAQRLGLWGRPSAPADRWRRISYRAYAETSQLGGDDESRLEEDLHSNEQRLFWHEDSKPGTLV